MGPAFSCVLLGKTVFWFLRLVQLFRYLYIGENHCWLVHLVAVLVKGVFSCSICRKPTKLSPIHSYFKKGMAMQPDTFLCYMFLLSFLALTLHKPQ